MHFDLDSLVQPLVYALVVIEQHEPTDIEVADQLAIDSICALKRQRRIAGWQIVKTAPCSRRNALTTGEEPLLILPLHQGAIHEQRRVHLDLLTFRQ